jgi:hypothetical protein
LFHGNDYCVDHTRLLHRPLDHIHIIHIQSSDGKTVGLAMDSGRYNPGSIRRSAIVVAVITHFSNKPRASGCLYRWTILTATTTIRSFRRTLNVVFNNQITFPIETPDLNGVYAVSRIFLNKSEIFLKFPRVGFESPTAWIVTGPATLGHSAPTIKKIIIVTAQN